jgi:hypothetical protein
MENMFCEAEDRLREGFKQEALELFDQIVEQEALQPPQERKQSFQSLRNAIVLRSREGGHLARVDRDLTALLVLFQYQYRNEGNEGLNSILDVLLTVEEDGVT